MKLYVNVKPFKHKSLSKLLFQISCIKEPVRMKIVNETHFIFFSTPQPLKELLKLLGTSFEVIEIRMESFEHEQDNTETIEICSPSNKKSDIPITQDNSLANMISTSHIEKKSQHHDEEIHLPTDTTDFLIEKSIIFKNSLELIQYLFPNAFLNLSNQNSLERNAEVFLEEIGAENTNFLKYPLLAGCQLNKVTLKSVISILKKDYFPQESENNLITQTKSAFNNWKKKQVQLCWYPKMSVVSLIKAFQNEIKRSNQT